MKSRKLFTLGCSATALLANIFLSQNSAAAIIKAEDFCPLFEAGGIYQDSSISCSTQDFTAIAHESRHFGSNLTPPQIIEFITEFSPEGNLDFINLCASTNETLKQDISRKLAKLLSNPPSSDFVMALGLCSPDNDTKNRVIGYFSKNRELIELAMLAIDSSDPKISGKAFDAFQTLFKRLGTQGQLSYYKDTLLSGLKLLSTCGDNDSYAAWANDTLSELKKPQPKPEL